MVRAPIVDVQLSSGLLRQAAAKTLRCLGGSGHIAWQGQPASVFHPLGLSIHRTLTLHRQQPPTTPINRTCLRQAGYRQRWASQKSYNLRGRRLSHYYFNQMKFRKVKLISNQEFMVPQGIQRIDTKSTHGWQVRYHGTKYFSDRTPD